MNRYSLTATLFVFLIGPVFSQGSFGDRLAGAALELTYQKVVYDASYYRLKYPMGDVPPDKWVCTDVVIRAYRKLGTDLQQEVHEDMKKNFGLYPQNWRMKTTDRNIDHRRVPNLATFFARKGISLRPTRTATMYLPGDIVTWDLGRGLTHVGIVSGKKIPGTDRYFIVHNIGNGQELSDCLFSFTITGHYRYTGNTAM